MPAAAMRPFHRTSSPPRPAPPTVLPSESDAAAAPAVPATSLAALISGHILRDGEVVLFILRPSRWFILLSSLKSLAGVLIGMVLAAIYDERLMGLTRQVIDLGIFLIACRLMWATLQWLNRFYILTDLRVIRLGGVFSVDIFDCPLRRVARTLLEVTFKERLFRLGSIVIIPQDEDRPLGVWRMVGHPRAIHEQLLAAIAKAKHNGLGA